MKLYRLSGSGDLGSEFAGKQCGKSWNSWKRTNTWELYDSSAPRHHGACLTVELPLVSPQLRIFFGPDATLDVSISWGARPLRMYRPTPLSIPFFFSHTLFFCKLFFRRLVRTGPPSARKPGLLSLDTELHERIAAQDFLTFPTGISFLNSPLLPLFHFLSSAAERFLVVVVESPETKLSVTTMWQMFDIDWWGLALPFAYLLVLSGALMTFSTIYRKRKAGKLSRSVQCS